jgi:hypothetical protein
MMHSACADQSDGQPCQGKQVHHLRLRLSPTDGHQLTRHPENNVKYYYGGRNASQNRIGRLMLREDGTGAIEYFYGKMGEVTKTRRTLIVPNQAIATYVTQWTYDSHNRLLEMIYPDEDKITYSYNLGGQLEKVHGYKSYGYDYVSKIGYDKFEQRTYITEQLQIISHSRGSAFLFSTSTSKAFWMESNNCSMSLLVSTASLLLSSFGCFRALC